MRNQQLSQFSINVEFSIRITEEGDHEFHLSLNGKDVGSFPTIKEAVQSKYTHKVLQDILLQHATSNNNGLSSISENTVKGFKNMLSFLNKNRGNVDDSVQNNQPS